MDYYTYMLLYVEDCLAISENVTKELVIRDPEMYLGAKLRLTELPNGIVPWGLSTSKYVQEAIRNA